MITRQRLQDWIEDYRVQLTPEAVGALLALDSVPTPAIRVTPVAMGPVPRTLGLDTFEDRVTEVQARVFAGYREDEIETVWYRAMPTSPWEGEFEALRDLAADLLDARSGWRSLTPLIPVFRAAVRYRDCWTPNCVMSVNQAARELVDAVRQAEEMIRTDRDVDGSRPPG